MGEGCTRYTEEETISQRLIVNPTWSIIAFLAAVSLSVALHACIRPCQIYKFHQNSGSCFEFSRLWNITVFKFTDLHLTRYLPQLGLCFSLLCFDSYIITILVILSVMLFLLSWLTCL